MGDGNTATLRTLCNLRWLAVACQVLTLLVVSRGLGIALPMVPMAAAVGVLAVFNVYAGWRARKAQEVTAGEVFAHIVVDVAVLAWLIVFGGGIVNPFTSLFLLPIAFAALALPLPWLYATAATCALGYAGSIVFGRPLPHVHGLHGDAFDLHLWGMVVNFAISVLVVLYFFSRLAIALRRREQELAGLRERFARNEGIIALATHAASVAHELNTPLGTLTLLLDELLEQPHAGETAADLATARQLVDVCRDRVRALAGAADPSGSVMRGDDLERVIARWQLVRPTVQLLRSGHVDAAARIDPAVAHMLQALLNNAADAGEAAGDARVTLHLDADADGVRGEISDHGAGFGEQARAFLPGVLFASGKADGLGVGLALSHATVERLGGELSMQPNQPAGVRVRFRLPAGGATGTPS